MIEIQSISLLEAINNKDLNEFLKESNNFTLFHLPKFLSYHNDKFLNQEKFLIWIENKQIIAAMPYLIKDRVFLSPYGASYGGIVFKKNIKINLVEKIFEVLFDFIKEKNTKKIIIGLVPNIYCDDIHEYLEFFFHQKNFLIHNIDLSSYITLNSNYEQKFSSSCLKAIKKATKNGIITKISDDYDSFFKILIDNRKIKNATPTHSLNEIKFLTKLFQDKIYLYGAFYQEKMIAGSLLFECNTKVILDFYWAHISEYQEYRPLNLLIRDMLRNSKDNHFKYFDFGRQTNNMLVNYGSSFFKESFGANGCLVKKYEFNL